MRFKDIRRHLKAYSIVGRRTTTILNGNLTVRIVVRLLKRGTTCTQRFETACSADLDTLSGTCSLAAKPCNSRKGNRKWVDHLERLDLPSEVLEERRARLITYLSRYEKVETIPKDLPEYEQLQELRRQVLALFSRADELATQIRKKTRAI